MWGGNHTPPRFIEDASDLITFFQTLNLQSCLPPGTATYWALNNPGQNSTIDQTVTDRPELLVRCHLYHENYGSDHRATYSEWNIQLQSTPSAHPDTLNSMANLAATYRNQGRWEEAEQLNVKVMETCKRKLGEEHPDTLASIANLALTYSNQGRWEEAEQLNVQVLETRKRKLGEDHPSTLNSMANLAFSWKSSAHNAEAISPLRECLTKQKQTLDLNHPNTLSNSQTLLEWNTEATRQTEGEWETDEEWETDRE